MTILNAAKYILLKGGRWAALSFVVLLTGCASQEFLSENGFFNTKSGQSTRAMAAAEDDQPVIPFDAETLYDLLVAEVGGHRKRYDLALGNYLKQAHNTRDAGVVQRAYQIAVYVGARQAALDSVQLWSELQPSSLEAISSLSLELVYAGQLEQSFQQMQKVLELGGRAAFDMLARGASGLDGASADGRRRALIDQLNGLQGQYSKNRELMLGRAILFHQIGDYEQALTLSDKLLIKNRNDTPVIMVKGRALSQLNRNDEAEKLLVSALERNSDNGRLRLLYGRILVQQDKLVEARAQFEILQRQAPDDSDILLSLALITLENNMDQDAELYFQQLLALGQRSSTANYYLGRLSEKQEKYQAARSYYASVDPSKEFMAAQIAVTQMLVEQGQLEEARGVIDRARKRNPAKIEALFLLEGELLVSDRQLEKALELFERGLKTNPESTNLLYSRAMAFEKMDDLGGLEKDLREILRIEPDNAAAMNALGYTLADRTDRLEEAEALISQAFALNGEDPAIMDSMGWVQFRLGNYEQAEKYLKMAYERFKDAEVAAHLGEVLWAKGDREAARQLFAEALNDSPDSVILQETVDRLIGGPLAEPSETVSTIRK
ncbi:tetratricopeptide repeat protein [Endozoicomonas ascidiicola]|uniref:tetratricopeptide repeat protein n=1 Tax=Endozoicomonas ascidiicola TaxID=1698521 RepID=UPI0008354A8F|nr:tetratricopeptide repeat protein [Endozoicomonas ascidiicola]